MKVWRVLEASTEPSSPVKASKLGRDEDSKSGTSPKALSGRNCLLGTLVDAKFACVVSVSDKEAVVCTTQGDLCLIDDSEGQQRLTIAKNVGFGVQCICKDPIYPLVMVGGRNGQVHRQNLDQIRDLARNQPTPPAVSRKTTMNSTEEGEPPDAQSQSSDLLALASILGKLVILDADHRLSIAPQIPYVGASEQSSFQKSFPAHRDAVEGVQIVANSESNIQFVTWSRDGDVKCWDAAGTFQSGFQVELDQLDTDGDFEVRNELKTIRAMRGGKSFVTGDKYGVIKYA